MKVTIVKSPNENKKWRAVFVDDEGNETNVDFGQSGYEDFTQHKNRLRRSQYLARHKAREDWYNPMTAGSLSRWILWGDTPSFDSNVTKFKQRFNLE